MRWVFLAITFASACLLAGDANACGRGHRGCCPAPVYYQAPVCCQAPMPCQAPVCGMPSPTVPGGNQSPGYGAFEFYDYSEGNFIGPFADSTSCYATRGQYVNAGHNCGDCVRVPGSF